MLPAATPRCFTSKRKKEQTGRNQKNRRVLFYFEDMLVGTVLASLASFLWYDLLFLDVPAHKVIGSL